MMQKLLSDLHHTAKDRAKQKVLFNRASSILMDFFINEAQDSKPARIYHQIKNPLL